MPANGAPAVDVLITLREEPASRVFDRVKKASSLPPDDAVAAAKVASAAQATKVRQQQDRVLDTLKKPPYRATLIYRLDRSTNAIAVRIAGTSLPRVRALADVKSAGLIPTDVPTTRKPPLARTFSVPDPRV